MIQKSFDDVVLYEHAFDIFIPKLVALSHLHKAITININSFTKILKHKNLLDALTVSNEAITKMDILKQGLYYKINRMNVYVAKHVHDNCYEIREE